MAVKKDWLDPGRRAQLNISKNWLSILNEETEGKDGVEREVTKKYVAWGIPESAVTDSVHSWRRRVWPPLKTSRPAKSLRHDRKTPKLSGYAG